MKNNNKILLFIILYLSINTVVGQEYYNSIDTLIKYKYKQFDRINSFLRKNNRDSIAMNRLLKKSEANDYIEGKIYALLMLGKIARINTKYDKAIGLYQKAFELARDNNKIGFEIYSLNMIGVVYRRMDAVKSALEYHYKALQIALSEKNITKEIEENIAISNNSIGNIYLLLEKPGLAKQHFEKALEIEKKYNNKLGLAINYQNIGSIFEERDNYEMAMNYYKKSLAYNDTIHSLVGKIICNTSIGNLYLKENKPKLALKIIKPNVKLAEKLGDKYYISSVYTDFARALINIGQTKKAKEYLLKSLKISNNIPSLNSDIYKQLSIIAEKNNDNKLALEYYKKYNSEEKKVYNKKNRQLVSDLVIKQLRKESESKIQQLGEKNKEVSKRLKRSRTSIYFLFSLLILLIILAYILYQQNKLRNQRKVINLEQSLLRAQMNPHFIFNSLNSVKLFIIHNKSKDAISFLSKFAKLIRAILNSTKQKEMSLKEEIEMIKLYINIENIRLNNTIEYSFDIDSEIDLETVKIPSFLTQPFIENALWHGLSHMPEDNRKLKISIKKSNNKIISIEIQDNGIGRKRALEIKKSKIFYKKSLGIDLSNERLKMFAKSNEYNIKFEDLYDNEGKASGTKVIILIPNKKNDNE